ncbi:hypothetical protein [Legionella fairfieldensis]|uniref:hypothetical protein n=1 Tax=Legionella fairfieldensis TaxID=45064 RepID=UPI00048F571C|nr:hypothetical protein [Legionella fairfieldensis]
MDIVGMLVNLVSGGVGGNILGAAWKEKSLGAIGNTIAGLVGGVAGTYIMQAVGVLNSLGLGNMSVSSLLGNVGSSAVSGAVLTAIVGLIKNSMSNKA